jgi:hypothetical protein
MMIEETGINARWQGRLFPLEAMRDNGRVLLTPTTLAESTVVSGPDEAMRLRLELLLR